MRWNKIQRAGLWLAVSILVALPAACGGGSSEDVGTGGSGTSQEPAVAALLVSVDFEDKDQGSQAVQESFQIQVTLYTERLVAGCDGLTGSILNGRLAQQSQVFSSSGLTFDFSTLDPAESPIIVLAEAFDRSNAIVARGCKAGVTLQAGETIQESLSLKPRILALLGDYGSTVEVALGAEDFDQVITTIQITACLYICQPQGLECRDPECAQQLNSVIDVLRNLNEILLHSSFDTQFGFETQETTVTGTLDVLTYHSKDSEGKDITIDLTDLGMKTSFTGQITQGNVFDSNPFLLPVDAVALTALLLEEIKPRLSEEQQQTVDQLLLLLNLIPQIQIENVQLTIIDGRILDPTLDDIGKTLQGVMNIVARSATTGGEIYSTSAPFVAEMK
ncbi:MAG: hypothetical protein D6812_06415 [Deltaproteobacteria bacterium]|nr:MAG: hypothetical protein D6812_06415 [Deltaproteobacteria bacterium]